MKRLLITLSIIFASKFAFCQWMPLISGTTQELQSVWFTDNTTGYAAGRSGTILKTTDGISWSLLNSNTTVDLMSIRFVNDTTGFVCGYSGTILKTIDGGVTWIPQISGTSQLLYKVFFVDQNNGYISGLNGVCLKTTTGGATWNLLNLGTTSGEAGLFFTSIDTGYVVGDGSTDAIIKTIDGGSNWNSVFNTFGAYSSIYFTNASTGYATTSTFGGIYSTTNAGASWQFQTSFGTGLYSIKFPSSNIGYTVGGSYTPTSMIFKTTDAGANWMFENPYTQYCLFDVFFLNDTVGYAVGMNGTIIKTTNGGLNGIENNLNTRDNISVYPNPTSASCYYQFSRNSTSPLHYEICDISGQVLLQAECSSDGYGEIDLNMLSPSFYFISILNEKNEMVLAPRKIIKL